MSTYSLLQISLDQSIGRDSLEKASEVVPSVARVDCARIERNLFGIVMSGMLHEDATAFQVALKRQGFPTEVVAEDDIPVLHEPFTIQRIEILKNGLLFTDAMGRESHRPIGDLVFLAGGFMTRSRMKTELVPESNITHTSREAAYNVGLERKTRFDDVPEFRLDFFFWSAPNRLRACVSEETMTFFQGRAMRLRDNALLLGAMMDLRELLPAERVGSGLKRSDTQIAYPSLRSYEEEIRWHFHRLGKEQ